jgi:hypothetical protein
VGIDGNAENSFQRGEEISLGRTEERMCKNRGNNLKRKVKRGGLSGRRKT